MGGIGNDLDRDGFSKKEITNDPHSKSVGWLDTIKFRFYKSSISRFFFFGLPYQGHSGDSPFFKTILF